MRGAAWLFGAWLVLGGCTKRPEAGSAGSAAPGPGVPALPATTSPTPAPRESAAPSAAAGLAITNLAPGSFELEPEHALSLGLVAAIERQNADGSWQALQHLDLGAGFRLVEQCEPGALPPPKPEAGACVELAAGKPFHPVPLTGLGCSAQCNHICRSNGWEGPGKFRLVASECRGSASFVGPTFELPGPELSRALPRWGIGGDVSEASVMRLDIPSAPWNLDDPPSPGKVAGLTVRSGTEAPLAASGFATLRELLRAEKGFDDDVMKRCAMKHLVGFRLALRPATTGTPRKDLVELAIDFNCQKLFVVRGGTRGEPRSVHATHFDPSRAAFLQLAKHALPNDSELAKLH